MDNGQKLMINVKVNYVLEEVINSHIRCKGRTLLFL
jgi:hypothetical protein